ncbi:MAG: MarC family protein [Bacteroidaceae bacterium]|jgi:multiple antibiotic resistance protein|nr:MarC family protein [Bacteroidaceae bacterium]
MQEFFSAFNIKESIGTFLILFAIIDVLGSTPIIIDLREKGKTVSPRKATLSALGLLLVFYVGGDAVLRFFSVDINSFAVAGSILLFLMALEMLLDIEIFKYNGPTNEATFIPLVFPLLAGAGALTTIIALKSEYADINILVGLLLNMVWVYIVLVLTEKIQRRLGKSFIYMLRKFFGVMLLAISVGMFTSNLTSLIQAK